MSYMHEKDTEKCCWMTGTKFYNNVLAFFHYLGFERIVSMLGF